ncbi:MAG: leucine--tRNA ligase [Candidatus Hodarchaeales archaeon]|jgi:leucyl-tRNA synthetase
MIITSLLSKWEESGFFKSKIDKTKPKFFIIFAYPGSSGFLHTGHLRSFTYPDVIAKFKRLSGFNVFFPAGIHASGNVSINFSEKVRSGAFNTYLENNNCTTETIEYFQTPEGVVNYFEKNYHDIWHFMGYFIDQDSRMTTIDEGYKKFIQWQFRTLKKRNFLIQKAYISPICPIDGPVAIDTAETDISEGGSAEIQEYTVIKLILQTDSENQTIFIPVATLRPETIFGITCIWVAPKSIYVLIKLSNKEHWIIAEESIPNFDQDQEITIVKRIKSEEIIGKTVICPLSDQEVPIVSSEIVIPATGTGIVMSVPAHAPVDFMAYKQNSNSGIIINKPIIVIESGFSVVPTEFICNKHKIKNINDIKGLKKATEILYSKELKEGTMNTNNRSFSGLSVIDARSQIKQTLISFKQAFIIFAFNQRVVCRCGKRIRIRNIPDQWFINYSNPEITQLTKEHIDRMTITPKSYKQSLPNTLDWFKDRPCIRKGKWLGTSFPIKTYDDINWIIEPIADSTIYPVYYIFAKYLNQGNLDINQLTDDFFNFIFYDEGSIHKVQESTGIHDAIIYQIKEEFNYWYPLDMNFGGKEHRTVHFPVFLKMHMMLFSQEKQPKGIFVNWWVYENLDLKEKIAKSKGSASSIMKVIDKYSVDAIRAYYSHIASPHVDIEWNEERVAYYQKLIDKITSIIISIFNLTLEENQDHLNLLEWFEYEMISSFNRIHQFYEALEIRKACQECFYTIPHIIHRYRQRGGKIDSKVRSFVKKWVIYLSPVIPFTAESFWQKLGNEHSIFVNDPLKNCPERPSKVPIINQEENFIEDVINDAMKLKKILTKKGQFFRLNIFTDPKATFPSNKNCNEVLHSAQSYIEKKIHLQIRINPKLNFNPPKRKPKLFKVAFSMCF